MSPITKCLKKGNFEWTKEVCEAPILALPDFNKVFEVECHANRVGIEAVLTQDKRSLAYYGEKLNDSRRKYSTYDKEFYAIIRALDHWSHYLRPKQFVHHLDHQALKFINGQHKLNSRHAEWVEFLQSFSFVSRYKQGGTNVVADAFSRRYSILSILDERVLGFSMMRGQYKQDEEMAAIMAKCTKYSFEDYVVQNGFLFKGNKLCVPHGSFRELLVREVHRGGLAGPFGVTKIVEVLRKHFYWPKMLEDVQTIVARCGVCHRAKSQFKPGYPIADS
ncbi:hypothetical protein Pint_16013 [Pistacia integerrima]|uniref:Uncharacterized protein n=1 Tax=Pistacia integerrima TaxID=434235 RepID=A0ACC0ZDT3_9ROSI|nr:hypothetical protein Pint_16013 [Pistacia integerrima]